MFNSTYQFEPVQSILKFLSHSTAKLLKYCRRYGNCIPPAMRIGSVFIFGNSKDGKSTVASILTNQPLTSVEINSGEYFIEDSENRISGLSTKPKTIIPELMINEKSGQIYFDFPAFCNPIDFFNYNAAITCLRDIYSFEQSVKMLFVIGHSSVRICNGNPIGFLEMLENVNIFIDDIEMFRNSIALVVTKVENLWIFQNNQIIFSNDEQIIDTIAASLKQFKSDIEEEQSENNIKKIQFIDILLEKNPIGKYTKIAIMRLPIESGILNKMECVKRERSDIEFILEKNLDYAQINQNNEFK